MRWGEWKKAIRSPKKRAEEGGISPLSCVRRDLGGGAALESLLVVSARFSLDPRPFARERRGAAKKTLFDSPHVFLPRPPLLSFRLLSSRRHRQPLPPLPPPPPLSLAGSLEMISIPPSVSPPSSMPIGLVVATQEERETPGGGVKSPPKTLRSPPSLRATPRTKVYPFFYLPFSLAETGPNRLTVGKIYGGMLILENWKMTRFAALPPARKGLPVSPTNYVRCLPASPVYDSGMPRATMCARCRDLNLPFSVSCRGQVEPKQQALGHVDVPSLFFPRMRARPNTQQQKRES